MKTKFSFSLNSAVVTFYLQSSPCSVFPVSSTAVSRCFPPNNGAMLLSLLTSPWMTWLSQVDCFLFQWLSHVSRHKGFLWKSIEMLLLKLPNLVGTLLILSCAPEVMIFVFYPQLMPDIKSGWAGRREKFSDTVVSNSQLHPHPVHPGPLWFSFLRGRTLSLPDVVLEFAGWGLCSLVRESVLEANLQL